MGKDERLGSERIDLQLELPVDLPQLVAFCRGGCFHLLQLFLHRRCALCLDRPKPVAFRRCGS